MVFFCGARPELVEQHRAQLLGGVDDERVRRRAPGSRPRARPPPSVSASTQVAQVARRRPARRRPPCAPARGPAAARSRRRGRAGHGRPGQRRRRLDQPVHRRGAPARLLGRVGRGAVEVELARGRGVGRAHLDARVRAGQVLEQVLRLGRVDEVGGDRGVDAERREVDAEGGEPAHQRLGAGGHATGTPSEQPASAGRRASSTAARRQPQCTIDADGDERQARQRGAARLALPRGRRRRRPARPRRARRSSAAVAGGDVDLERPRRRGAAAVPSARCPPPRAAGPTACGTRGR